MLSQHILRIARVALATALPAMTAATAPHAAAASQPDPAGVEFFESKVRPLLVDHCYSCHAVDGQKPPKGGLRLDYRDGLLTGGDSGPAIVPGAPENSLLIKAVRYADEDLQMPPKGKKLSEDQIETLAAWVRMGAPDPRTGEVAETPGNGEKHWAFQPLTRPPVPEVRNRRWVQTPVDHFILAELEKRGMTPNPQADKRTLLRRVTYDLTGLPPTPSEVESFLSDKSPNAFARVVDRLLASPHYGERWGRHWLDVARYADTKGYLAGNQERRYPYSYTYRDYVIRAFNDDLPFDQFIHEQLAADLLPGEDKQHLAALGYLTLGRRFINNIHDIIDDRIDVVTRGFMGLTVSCARCHDHKYDPIPTADYYSLYGVFSSSTEPAELPLLGTEPPPKEHEAYLAERKKREEALATFRKTKTDELLAAIRKKVGDYLLAAHDAEHLESDALKDTLARERKLHPEVLQRWLKQLKTWHGESHPAFAPWFAFAALPKDEFEAKGPETAAALTSLGSVHPLVAQRFSTNAPRSLREVADAYNTLFSGVNAEWQKRVEAARKSGQEPPAALDDADRESLRLVLFASGTPTDLAPDLAERLFNVTNIERVRQLKREIDELDAVHPGAPARAMALVDKAKPAKAHIFIRGNAGNQGAEVPRRFLEVLSAPDRQPFTNGSGRLELARGIASPENPLTARVWVNRVWLHHLGAALVRTPSDFGVRSDPPTHPELLDYLAARFMDEGWSVKTLHRLILLSSAYQQTSSDNPAHATLDPENRLLWRMNRRRLSLEEMRDTFLTVAGTLDAAAGGQPVELTTEPFSKRRTIYGFIDRQNLPGLFRTFDFASPDTTSPQRFVTTVPQQALFLMNSPFVLQQSASLVSHPEFAPVESATSRIRALFALAYQREPTRDELRLAAEYLGEAQATNAPLFPVHQWSYGYGRFDEGKNRVADFTPLPHFTGSAVQGSGEFPDPKLGWIQLTPIGGHPGTNPHHAAIRRWTARRDGVLAIRGTLSHASKNGDGVRGRVVSSNLGKLGEWTAQDGKADAALDNVTVRAGDTIDFVTDCRDTLTNDTFEWAPEIRYTGAAAAEYGARSEWVAGADFVASKQAPAGPQTPWQQLAQVLLLSNELMFVD